MPVAPEHKTDREIVPARPEHKTDREIALAAAGHKADGEASDPPGRQSGEAEVLSGSSFQLSRETARMSPPVRSSPHRRLRLTLRKTC